MQIRLDGQVALVTGASSGIGAAIAELLGLAGARVVVNYHTNEKAAAAVVDRIVSQGGTALAVQADVTQAGDVDRLVSRAQAAFGGRVDILVNNAGSLVKRAPLHEYPEEAFAEVLALNVRSVFLCSKAVIPIMREQRSGRIVNITSQAARSGGGPGAVPYAAAKGMVNTMTKGMAKECAPFGITVNAVAPGVVETPFHDRFTPPDVLAAQVKAIPLGRISVPADSAKAVLYLVSALGDYVTGECMEVNGGMVMD